MPVLKGKEHSFYCDYRFLHYTCQDKKTNKKESKRQHLSLLSVDDECVKMAETDEAKHRRKWKKNVQVTWS